MATTVVVILLIAGFVVGINILSIVLARRFFPGSQKNALMAISSLFKRPAFKGSALIGTARVLSLEPTGTVINGLYLCNINLRVQISERQPYEVTVRKPVSPLSMAALQPGATVQVQVDSADPLNVRLDSSQPGPAAAGSPDSSPTLAQLADAYNDIKQSEGSAPGRWASAADLLESGQRVRGVLKSFAATGDTARSLGKPTSRPELLDAPRYLLEVELRFPNLAPVIGRNSQAVPPDEAPNLAIGRELTCAVDPADPSNRFVVDWDGVARCSASNHAAG
jgi:hypothetical protein